MATNGPFGFDSEEFDRVVREAGEEVKDLLEKLSDYIDRSSSAAPWASLFNQFLQPQAARPQAPKAEGATTGETGSGVWAIYTLDDEGGARIEQVYPTEIEALRANRDNTDESRRVRFLPYGVAVSVLDAS